MPNGGRDNCGTCSFNSRNHGESGHTYFGSTEKQYCLLRKFDPQEGAQSPSDCIAHWTYCANHSFVCGQVQQPPIGPVLRNYSGATGPRQVYIKSPDSAEIRDNLLMLIAGMSAEATIENEAKEYEAYFKCVVIMQLAEFREERAVPGLVRISSAVSGNSSVINHAKVALNRINNSRAEPTLSFWNTLISHAKAILTRQSGKSNRSLPFWPTPEELADC